MHTELQAQPIRASSRPELVTPEEAAKFLGLKVATLATWRCRRRYNLAFVRVGANIMYDMRDLIAFIESRRVVRRKPR
jgi:hypothetical protein